MTDNTVTVKMIWDKLQQASEAEIELVWCFVRNLVRESEVSE